jgi:quercetin dioxygenase-like cupin family protein
MAQGDRLATTRLEMGVNGEGPAGPVSALPTDDVAREAAIARPEDPALVHLAVVGDTYTVLVSGEQTAGRFAMLDMLIPPGGGPPRHRHDFEECFRVLEGSLEVQVRDLPPVRLEAGDTANIPANAPQAFRNPAQTPARLLCTVAPAGLERFFAEFGDPVPTRTSPAPSLSDAEREERLRRAMAAAPGHGMEILPTPAP